MFDTLYTALTATGSSALASVLTCFIMRWIMRHDEEERKKSEKELSNAREARLTKIEDGIEKVTSALQRHMQEDSKNPNADDISSINRRLDKIDDAQSRVTESLGEVKGSLQGIQTWMQNTNNALQNHITDHGIHSK